MPVIFNSAEVEANVLKLVSGCHVLGLPMLVSEQYSKGLGLTIPSVRESMREWYGRYFYFAPDELEPLDTTREESRP